MLRSVFNSISMFTLFALATNCALADNLAPDCAKHVGLPTANCLHALPKDGGGAGDSGGGSADPGPPLSAWEIKMVLENIQPTVIAFYNFISVATYKEGKGYFAWSGIGDHSKLGSLLFAGPNEDAIMRKVSEVKPTVLDHGPCYNKFHKSVEAAALKNPDRVCFNVELLEKRYDLRSTNGRAILVALAAHEYSHLIGANKEELGSEDDAIFIQKEVAQNFVSSHTFDYVQQDFPKLKRDLLNLADGVNNLKSMITTRRPVATICMFSGFDLGQIMGIFGRLFDVRSAASYVNRKEANLILGAFFKSGNYASFCEDDPALKSQLDKLFKGKRSISINEYMLDTNTNKNITPVEGNVRRIDYGDYADMELEVTDLQQRLAVILNAWPDMAPEK